MPRKAYSFERRIVSRGASFGVECLGLDCGHLVPAEGVVEHSAADPDAENDVEDDEPAGVFAASSQCARGALLLGGR